MLEADEVGEERGRVAVGDDRSIGADRGPISENHADRTSPLDLDARNPGIAVHRGTEAVQPSHERVRERLGAAFGDGESVALSQTREDPTEQPATGHLGPEIGVQRRAGEQQAGRLAVEFLGEEAAQRQQRPPPQIEGAADPSGPEQPEARPEGRKRPEQCAHEPRLDGRPTVEQRQIPLTAPGPIGIEGRCGHCRLPMQDCCWGMVPRVRDDCRRVAPRQPVTAQIEIEQWPRHGGQGVEGAVQVVAEAGRGQLAGANGPSRAAVRFEYHHAPAVLGQHVGGYEPVGARTDDHCVVALHPPSVSPLGHWSAPTASSCRSSSSRRSSSRRSSSRRS